MLINILPIFVLLNTSLLEEKAFAVEENTNKADLAAAIAYK
jgi:hypothetical protein